MAAHIALLRGINVGPHKRIAMADLRALVESLGHTQVRTLVNSGNVVFVSATDPPETDLADQIARAILTKTGLDVGVVVRTAAQIADVVSQNPFPHLESLPKQLHVSFLAEPLTPDQQARIEAIERGEDDVRIIGPHVYLSLPNLMSGATQDLVTFDRRLRVLATSRNWNTITKLNAMASEIDGD